MKMMNPTELLTKAKENIETDGWCQGVAQDETGRMCMLGAMARATGHLQFDPRTNEWCIRPGFYDKNMRAVRTMVKVLGGNPDEWVGVSASVIADHNDDKETTLTDVYTYFDKALAELGGLA